MYLKPVYGAAVDKRWKLSESIAECVTNGAHGEHYVELVTTSLDEHVEQCHRRSICLLIFVLLPSTNGQV